MATPVATTQHAVLTTTLKEPAAPTYSRLPTSVYRRVAQCCDERTRRQLAQVSQSWRVLVVPLLWETIYVYDYPDSAAVAAHINQHYREHVRHIRFQTRRNRREVPHWLDSPAEVAIIGAWLEAEWPRAASLFVRFMFTPVDVRVVEIARTMPQLTALAVENSYLPWRDVARWALAAPQLSDLSVAYATDLRESERRRFSHLLADYNVLQTARGDGFTRLRLQFQPDEMGIFYASILRSQPRLRELRIDSIPGRHLDALSQQLAYPSGIETLCLGIDTTESLAPLGCLTPRALPRLTRLMVRCNTNPLAQCHAAMDVFVRHEWPRLRSLVVSVLTNDQGRALPKACPGLEVLIVQPGSPTDHQIHNSGLEALLLGMRRLRRLHVAQQISPIGEMLSDAFIWKATRFDGPRVLSLRKSRRWEAWAPKLASSPWACAGLQDLSLCGVYLSFPALVQLLATLPRVTALKVCIRAGTVGTTVTAQMFEPWGRHSRLRSLVIGDIHEADLPHLRRLCELMPCIRNCRIVSQRDLSHARSDARTRQVVAAPSLPRDSSYAESLTSLKR